MVKLTAVYNSLGEICENIYHFSSGGPADSVAMNNLIDAFVAWENSDGKGNRPNTTQLTRVIATDLTVADGVLVDRAIVPQIVGVTGGVQCANNVTIAVAYRTGHRGRSFRGRTFHIGFPEGYRVGNTITGAAQTFLIQAYTHLLTLGVAPIFHLGVVSRYSGTVRRPTGIWTQATAVTLDTNIDSQRRRLPGHNRHH